MLHCREISCLPSPLAVWFCDRHGAGPGAGSDGDWRWRRVANIRVAQCNGNMWARFPGRRRRAAATGTIPMSQNRTGRAWHADPDRHEEEAGVDVWEGQVYNAKDSQLYSSTIKPVSADQMEIQGCVLGFLCGGETWTASRVRFPRALPTAWPRARQRPQGASRAAQLHLRRRRPRDRQPGAQAQSEAGGRAARRHRRYLPTPRHRAVCPLAPAETAARGQRDDERQRQQFAHARGSRMARQPQASERRGRRQALKKIARVRLVCSRLVRPDRQAVT